jgi:hypothetical protein
MHGEEKSSNWYCANTKIHSHHKKENPVTPNTKHEPRTWIQNCSKATLDLTGGYTEQSSLNPKYVTHI